MTILKSILAAILLCICTLVSADWVFKNPDQLSNYDGDTIKARLEVWPNHFVDVSIRVIGVDTPEIRSKCAEEKALAVKAQAFTAEQLNKQIEIDILGLDKYGRALGLVTIDGNRLDRMLIEAGLGRVYNGEARKGWCN